MLVLARELVADVRGDARLDAPRPERDEKEAEHQPERSGYERDDGASRRVREGERHDRAELPPEDVGDDRSDEGEEVGAGLEERVEGRRLGIPDAQELRHVDGEDGVDAVVAKTFRELVGDDERDATRHPVVASFRGL